MASNAFPAETIVCTVISKNYLAYARTLMRSVASVHPAWDRYVLIVDEIDQFVDPAGEDFQVLSVADLGLPEPRKFLFRYDLLEVNTAVKPWLLQWLFERTPARQVIYFDPDIRVYSPLTLAEQLLRGGALLTLTPHLLASLDDDRRPDDRDILQAGCYNLGFLGVSRHPELPRFLRWWQGKLTYDCRIDPAQGLFVDQKWMDLAPGLFPDVAVVRHPGYNVAYWNLLHRPVWADGAGAKVGDLPLVFFHFSGLDPLAPALLSRHQNRFRLKDLPACRALVESYCREVLANGWTTCKAWPYAFGSLHDGTPIPRLVRCYYRSHPEAIRQAGADPFAHPHRYLNDPVEPGGAPLITKLMYAFWESRSDLREAFPDVLGAGRLDFIHHFLTLGAWQQGVPEPFVEPVRRALREWEGADARPSEPVPTSLLIRDEARHPLSRLIVWGARLTFFLVPLPRLPERVRRYYQVLLPLKALLPAGVRPHLKRDLLRLVHRQQATRRSFGWVRALKAALRWLGLGDHRPRW